MSGPFEIGNNLRSIENLDAQNPATSGIIDNDPGLNLVALGDFATRKLE